MMDSSAANAMKILVVDDDSTCLAVVAALLRKWNFQVVTVKDPREALIIVGGVEGGFDVVIADVHMPEMNGFQLQQQITTDFQLPVILMSVDDRDNLVGRGVDFGATLFISKPVSGNDVRNYLWQITAASKKDDDQATAAAAAPTRPSTDTPAPNTNNNNNNNNNSEITREGEVTFKTNKLTGKKKLVWTSTLHYKFLDAITIIGLNNAAPKKILEVMDVPGITRDHVASHLQKYRMFLRRVSELTMPASQRNNVDWGFGNGVNLGPRIAAARRYGGMFSLINNLHTSLGGGRWWNNNIMAEEPRPMPPSAGAAGTFSSSSSFLFSDPPPRLAAASPSCNQPSWRPGYGTGGLQSSLLLSPHHHQQQLFNFGLLQSSPLIPAASTNMVNPIYQRSFTSLPPQVIHGTNDAIAAASPPVPTLQLQGGGGSSMLQPPQTYNNNNTAAETTRCRNIEIMVRGAAATRPNQLSGRVVDEVPPDPLDFDILFDIDDDDLTPPPSHPLHDDSIGTNTVTGGDETSTLQLAAGLGLTAPLSTESSMFDMMMSFFADDDHQQLDGGGLQATHDDLIIHNNDCENENSNFSNSSISSAVKNLTTTTPYYNHHDQDLPSLDQLLLEPRNDEELFLQSVFASMPFVDGAQEDHTSNN